MVMEKIVQIDFLEIDEKAEYCEIIERVVRKCFEEEDLLKKNLYLSVILTNPRNIQEMNNNYTV